ncbi:MAG: tRNA pseudouridine(38-40) synthase TruA [Caulobacterales bacterium]
MPRYKLTIEYDGGGFVGWQRTDTGPSVQSALEAAVLAFSGETLEVTGAGRTDSGVHALGQVAHVDFSKQQRPDTVRDALNAHLVPHPIAVIDAREVGDDFHARFSAIARTYLYRITDRRPPLTLTRGQVWRIPVQLDVDAMHAAAQSLVGPHDFTTFRDARCQAKSPEKTLDVLDVSRAGAEIHIWTKARSFLHRQVRSMAGSLVEVGRGKWQVRDMARALAARDRTECGPVAPADGLCLMRVDY